MSSIGNAPNKYGNGSDPAEENLKPMTLEYLIASLASSDTYEEATFRGASEWAQIMDEFIHQARNLCEELEIQY